MANTNEKLVLVTADGDAGLTLIGVAGAGSRVRVGGRPFLMVDGPKGLRPEVVDGKIVDFSNQSQAEGWLRKEG